MDIDIENFDINNIDVRFIRRFFYKHIKQYTKEELLGKYFTYQLIDELKEYLTTLPIEKVIEKPKKSKIIKLRLIAPEYLCFD